MTEFVKIKRSKECLREHHYQEVSNILERPSRAVVCVSREFLGVATLGVLAHKIEPSLTSPPTYGDLDTYYDETKRKPETLPIVSTPNLSLPLILQRFSRPRYRQQREAHSRTDCLHQHPPSISHPEPYEGILITTWASKESIGEDNYDIEPV